MTWNDSFYDEYNSFVLKRIYGEKKIRDTFGKIPLRTHQLPLPSFLERLTEKIYVVNEAQRQSIQGNDFKALIIEMFVEGKRAVVRASYMP